MSNTEAEYDPCACGVHVCGVIEDEEGARPVTLANFPTANRSKAIALWERLKAEFKARDGEPSDICFDLNLGTDDRHVKDFTASRQMLPRAMLASRAATPAKEMGR